MAISLVIVNARVPTGELRRPWADAIAIEGEWIRLVASSAEVMKLGDGAVVMDARGALVVPGTADAHAHPAEGGSDAHEQGAIRVGMLADLVVLGGDSKALLTIAGGKVVFEK